MADGDDKEQTALLPVFLKLAGRKVVVVGGGPVAAAKIRGVTGGGVGAGNGAGGGGLKGTGAEILVVAPEPHRDIRAQSGAGGGLTLLERPFRPADLDGAWLAIAAATPAVNREVAAAAEARRIFLVAVDDPEAASAYGGGTLRRAGITIALSTDGKAPALAGLLREGLEAVIPADDDLEAWVERARALRPAWRAEAIPMAERRPLLLQALNRLYAKDVA